MQTMTCPGFGIKRWVNEHLQNISNFIKIEGSRMPYTYYCIFVYIIRYPIFVLITIIRTLSLNRVDEYFSIGFCNRKISIYHVTWEYIRTTPYCRLNTEKNLKNIHTKFYWATTSLSFIISKVTVFNAISLTEEYVNWIYWLLSIL